MEEEIKIPKMKFKPSVETKVKYALICGGIGVLIRLVIDHAVKEVIADGNIHLKETYQDLLNGIQH